MICTFCKKAVNDKNLSAKDILNQKEWQKFLKLKKDKSVCLSCRTEYLQHSLI